MVKKIRTLHVRDVASKTFHIIGDFGDPDFDIDLHVDLMEGTLKVPPKYHKAILQLYGVSRSIYAEEILIEEDVTVSGGGYPDEIGDPIQKILEEIIKEK